MTIQTDWKPCWKLTNQDGKTMGKTQWGNDVENPDGIKNGLRGLCTPSFYHGYSSPYLAVFMNPYHAKIKNPILWEAEYRGKTEQDRGVKFGATEMRTVRKAVLPVLTKNQTVAIVIYLAAQSLDESDSKNNTWFEWAAKWINNEDRTYASAYSAYYAAAYYDSAYYAARAAACSPAAAAYSPAAAAAYSAAAAAYSPAVDADYYAAAHSAAAYSAASAAYSAAYYAAAAAYFEETFETAVAWALATIED